MDTGLLLLYIKNMLTGFTRKTSSGETQSKIVYLLLFSIFILMPIKSISAAPFSWALHGGFFYFAADNGVDSDPAPIIPSGGFSLDWQLMRYLKIEVTEHIYFTDYEYNVTLGYPMACNPENRSAFVLGFLTGVNAVGYFPIGEGAFRVFGGLAFDFRVITLAIGLNHPADFTGDIKTDAQLQTDAVSKYFWEKGRWFMPSAGFGFDFPINSRFLLGFDLRAWFPVYKIWASDKAPDIDGWRFGANLRITILEASLFRGSQ